MRFLYLLIASFAFSSELYFDYIMCAYLRQENPSQALSHCINALEKSPQPLLYEESINLLLIENKTEEALKLAKRFQKRFPKEASSYLLLYRINSRLGNQKAAISALESGILNANQPRVLLLSLLEEVVKNSDFAKAYELLNMLASVEPSSPIPHFLRARVALLQGDRELAISELYRAIEKDQNFEPAVSTLSAILESSGRIAEAKQLYLRLLARNPDNVFLLQRLANLYANSAEDDEALRVYSRLAELLPTPQVLFQLSLSLLRANKYSEALKVLEDLSAQNPDNYEVKYFLAIALEMDKKTERARALYNELRSVLGDHPRVLERLAVISLSEGKLENARELTQKALEKEPTNLQLNLIMSDVLKELGRYPDALIFAERSISISSNNYRPYFARALVYERIGDLVRAEQDLRKALELNPTSAELLNHLGYSLLLWYEDKRLDEAESLIRKALEKDPENPAYIDSLAWVLYYRGNYSKALELLQKALEKEKEDPVLYEHFGDVLVKLGKPAQARSYYLKAYELLKSGKRGEPNQKQRVEQKLRR
ncbi:MAG: tetratricopeptide repeat protein [Aquificaceae bacterium]|nr:tetratricopeptide repeat protein [Aquificaceae bacterium]